MMTYQFSVKRCNGPLLVNNIIDFAQWIVGHNVFVFLNQSVPSDNENFELSIIVSQIFINLLKSNLLEKLKILIRTEQN